MDALTTLPGQNNKGPILEALQKQLSLTEEEKD